MPRTVAYMDVTKLKERLSRNVKAQVEIALPNEVNKSPVLEAVDKGIELALSVTGGAAEVQLQTPDQKMKPADILKNPGNFPVKERGPGKIDQKPSDILKNPSGATVNKVDLV